MQLEPAPETSGNVNSKNPSSVIVCYYSVAAFPQNSKVIAEGFAYKTVFTFGTGNPLIVKYAFAFWCFDIKVPVFTDAVKGIYIGVNDVASEIPTLLIWRIGFWEPAYTLDLPSR